MTEGLTAALATPGLIALVAAVLAAGLIYGFAGFGAALLFMPVAAMVVPVPFAVAVFAVAGLASVVTVLPGAWARADRRVTLTMVAAATIAMPLGVWLLRHLDPTALRWTVSGLVAATLVAMLGGLRLRVGSGPAARTAVGALAGIVGGATGLLGPVVILVGLGDRTAAARMRANLAAFLTILNVSLVPQLALQGALEAPAVWLGVVLAAPYALATLVGRRLFDPERERLYRGVAYAVVAGSVVIGLPLFD